MPAQEMLTAEYTDDTPEAIAPPTSIQPRSATVARYNLACAHGRLKELDEAFAAHADPLHGVSTQDGFADLHRRLTRLHGAAGESAREP